MNPLLQQFIQEGRDLLQGSAESLMALERDPQDVESLVKLFRAVHTLKGNSGFFDFPAMTQVLHAAEDVLDEVRSGSMPFTNELADIQLEVLDLVSMQLDEVEQNKGILSDQYTSFSQALVRRLRILRDPEAADATNFEASQTDKLDDFVEPEALLRCPEEIRMDAFREAARGQTLLWVTYEPDEGAFYQKEDPFGRMRAIPGVLWGTFEERYPWVDLDTMDCYHCNLDFHALVAGSEFDVLDYFRESIDYVRYGQVSPLFLIRPEGEENGGPLFEDFSAEAFLALERGDWEGLRASVQTVLELSASTLWVSSVLRWLLVVLEEMPDAHVLQETLLMAVHTHELPPIRDVAIRPGSRPVAPAEVTPPISDEDEACVHALLDAQREILGLPDGVEWIDGRLRATVASIRGCHKVAGRSVEGLDEALAAALAVHSATPLSHWLQDAIEHPRRALTQEVQQVSTRPVEPEDLLEDAYPRPVVLTDGPSRGQSPPIPLPASTSTPAPIREPIAPAPVQEESRVVKKADEPVTVKVLKVEQTKVDRLMNLIGELVVAKNSLPYLAGRAENLYGVRELGREIKAEFSVINRIAEEMQDAIMQVRMMPVSFVFQRFPRLVRDISRQMSKEVVLSLEGEETQADKNVIEAMADPLMHAIRNSLDHGFEPPDERERLGKSREGHLLIRAHSESDRVTIEVIDDGRGIDVQRIRDKAREKGLVDEQTLERMTDDEALQLVFLPGLSTAKTITSVSGRGVGMDVVRSTLAQFGGGVHLSSELGKGTRLRLSLPLSMAVNHVMIVESNAQIFGIPMEAIVETVRVPQDRVQGIKDQHTTVLRGKIIPLVSLNSLLALDKPQVLNEEGEIAVLVVWLGTEQVGLIVDSFRDVMDVILKPLPGELGSIPCYAGSALLGDGSVLMVLNPSQLF